MVDNGIRTWRYLRLAIVALVLGLAAAIIWEWHLAPHNCLQQSISAYFYTPARGMFTGALIGIGVSLICIRGATDLEDATLNMAGIFAPMVALIPTPEVSKSCASYPGTAGGRVEGYTNAMVAVFVLGAAALLLVAGLAIAHRVRSGAWDFSVAALIGWLAGWAVWTAFLVVFAAERSWFDHKMHFTSAILMFVFAWIAVGFNTFDSRAPAWGWLRSLYLAVFIAMPVVAGAILIARFGFGWTDRWVFWFEVGEIIPFTAYWTVQSVHMWNKTTRP
jgi:hypothetical protein